MVTEGSRFTVNQFARPAGTKFLWFKRTGECTIEVKEALLAEISPVQRLALAYAPRRAQLATLALFALDGRLAACVRKGREPIVAQLRLAWWRDVLSKPVAKWPSGDMVLELLREWRDPSPLSELAVGWEALLAEELGPEQVAEFCDARGAAFAQLAEQLDADNSEGARIAGRISAAADLAEHLSDDAERALVMNYARDLKAPRLPVVLRPLQILAGLSAAAIDKGDRSGLINGRRDALRAIRIGVLGR